MRLGLSQKVELDESRLKGSQVPDPGFNETKCI